MALSQEDLAQLATFVEQRITAGVEALRADLSQEKTPEQQEAERAAVVGIPDVPHDAGPEFYIHLADGSVIRSHDSASTHMDVDGVTVQVIGRYQVGE